MLNDSPLLIWHAPFKKLDLSKIYWARFFRASCMPSATPERNKNQPSWPGVLETRLSIWGRSWCLCFREIHHDVYYVTTWFVCGSIEPDNRKAIITRHCLAGNLIQFWLRGPKRQRKPGKDMPVSYAVSLYLIKLCGFCIQCSQVQPGAANLPGCVEGCGEENGNVR